MLKPCCQRCCLSPQIQILWCFNLCVQLTYQQSKSLHEYQVRSCCLVLMLFICISFVLWFLIPTSHHFRGYNMGFGGNPATSQQCSGLIFVILRALEHGNPLWATETSVNIWQRQGFFMGDGSGCGGQVDVKELLTCWETFVWDLCPAISWVRTN